MKRRLAFSFDGTWNTVRDPTSVSRIHALITSTADSVDPEDVQLEVVGGVVLTDGEEDLLRQAYAATKTLQGRDHLVPAFVAISEFLNGRWAIRGPETLLLQYRRDRT